jgi:riboflavin kinase/FMN adenylyltransferase
LTIIPFEKEINLGFRPVMTIGMFDGVHIGHQKLLSSLNEKAQELNTKSILITFDKHPQLVLKPQHNDTLKLLQTNEERFAKLQSFGVENIITIHFTKEFASLSAIEFLDLLIDKYSPSYLLRGYDNNFGNKPSEQFDDLVRHSKQRDLTLERTDACVFYGGIEVSSTQIRKALLKGDMQLAKAMLNEPYALRGKVVQGNKIGRTLGFPTANIKVDKNKLLPLFGVYTTKVILENKEYNGIVNIGCKPTFENSLVTIEVNIFDFAEDIYNKSIKLLLLDYLREEMRFENLEDLQKQISLDVKKAKSIFANNE